MQNLSIKNISHPIEKKYGKRPTNLLSELIKDEQKKVNAFITSNIKSEVPLIPLLSDHLLKSGGKRIRPAVTILVSKLFNYNYGNRHIKLAACIELIHMASLLHDDVVDESSMRRGKTSANLIWGNKASILVGDYLFSKAFQILVEDNDPLVLKTLSEVSRALAQGEVMQLSLVNNIDISKEKYFKVIEDKTAKLFSAAALIGGIVSGVPSDLIVKLKNFGNLMGTSFQILDDALDYDIAVTGAGKKIGADFREGKVTLPVLLALEKSSSEEKKFWARTMEGMDQRENDFKFAVQLLEKYNCLNETKKVAAQFSKKAEQIIKKLPQNIYSEALINLVKIGI